MRKSISATATLTTKGKDEKLAVSNKESPYSPSPDLINKKIDSAIADLRSQQELSKGLHGISPEKVSSTYSFIHSLIELKFYLKSEFNDFYRHYDNRKMTLGGK